MKFAQIVLGLVAASAVLADTVSLSGDCQKAYAEYEECGKTEVEGFEKIYQSDKCQNYYKDPIATLAKCGDLDAETKDKLIADVKFSQAFNVLHTAKTEDGKACPLYRNKKVEKVKDTCASKSCTTASIEAYKLYVEGKKLNKNDATTIATYEEILKGLQECAPAGANNAANNSTSTVAGNSTDANAANANGNAAANNGTQVAVNGNGNQNAANNNANANSSDATTLKYTMALVFAAIYLLF
ncbi:hypothetical protein H8356DRAFT_1707963 [Neocallimastix lanati (nom. inval.)]|nr:hypothetical protein H8356DRAFT_1707963 [Neocallimastix sp. JGI-2020a]